MDREKVAETVRLLRLALGDTQQSFAYRIKTAIRTVAHYESDRPPGGRALANFASLATSHGHHEFARVFRRALAEELGTLGPGDWIPRADPQDIVETQWTAAILEVLRNNEYAHLIPKLVELLKEPTEKSKISLFIPAAVRHPASNLDLLEGSPVSGKVEGLIDESQQLGRKGKATRKHRREK